MAGIDDSRSGSSLDFVNSSSSTSSVARLYLDIVFRCYCCF